MQIFNFFNALANQYTQKYLTRVSESLAGLPTSTKTETPAATQTGDPAQPATDSYLPTNTNADNTTDPTYTKPAVATDQPNDSETVNPDSDTTVPVDAEDTTADESANTTPMTISRSAELGYNLTLQFDLATFTRTIDHMANGELTESDQLAMASFGLSTDFQLSGKEVIELQSGESVEHSLHALSKQSLKQRQASLFSAQSRDFNAFSFMRSATDIRQKIDIKFQGNARKAVNKFALRYKTDSQFSFNFAQRLRVQTDQMGQKAPESVGNYLDSAGDVALSGTDQMMAAFFDAVEGYLAENHTQTSESVTAFFNQAATALGLSETEVAAMASSNLTNTIDNFFERVSNAVSDLRALYLGEPTETQATDIAQIPAEYDLPESIPVGATTDSSATAQQQLAVA